MQDSRYILSILYARLLAMFCCYVLDICYRESNVSKSNCTLNISKQWIVNNNIFSKKKIVRKW